MFDALKKLFRRRPLVKAPATLLPAAGSWLPSDGEVIGAIMSLPAHFAPSSGLHPYGSKIEVSDDGNSWNAIAEVADIDPPDETVIEAKATHLLSDNAAKEKKPGISETGDCKFMLNFTKAQFNTFKGYRRLMKFWRISHPLDVGETTPTRYVFQGFWKRLGTQKLDPEATQVIQAAVEIAVTGIITYTQGA